MRRRKTAIVFLVLGICLIAIAVGLNVGWILLNLREVALLVLGVVFFALIITGMVLNTIFLVREIRRSEQHDAFLNSVTHELKTPIASIKLYLETLKVREVAPEKRAEFYDVMLADTDRLLHTVEQVLQAGRTGEKRRQMNVSEVDVSRVLTDAISIVRSRYHLDDDVIRLTEPAAGSSSLFHLDQVCDLAEHPAQLRRIHLLHGLVEAVQSQRAYGCLVALGVPQRAADQGNPNGLRAVHYSSSDSRTASRP